MDENIYQQLSQFIADQILRQPERPIAPGEPLISTGLIDSFSLVDLSLHIEETYSVQIDDTELNADTFDTLDQLIALIQERK